MSFAIQNIFGNFAVMKKAIPFIFILMLNVSWVECFGQMERDTVIENKVIDMVHNLKIVQNKIKEIDSLYNYQRRVLFRAYISDSTKNIYLVELLEDIGPRYVTLLNVEIDAKNMKILNEYGLIKDE